VTDPRLDFAILFLKSVLAKNTHEARISFAKRHNRFGFWTCRLAPSPGLSIRIKSARFKIRSEGHHAPWFSPDEYKQIYAATREYAKSVRIQDRWAAEQVHDFVLFMAHTGLRPDEAKNLQHRDVKIVNDEATSERILEIEVRGKRERGHHVTSDDVAVRYVVASI
jgi:integrase